MKRPYTTYLQDVSPKNTNQAVAEFKPIKQEDSKVRPKYLSLCKSLPASGPADRAHIILDPDYTNQEATEFHLAPKWLPDIIVSAIRKHDAKTLNAFLDRETYNEVWYLCCIQGKNMPYSWSVALHDGLPVPQQKQNDMRWTFKNIKHNFYASIRMIYNSADASWHFGLRLPRWSLDLARPYNYPIDILNRDFLSDQEFRVARALAMKRARFFFDHIKALDFETTGEDAHAFFRDSAYGDVLKFCPSELRVRGHLYGEEDESNGGESDDEDEEEEDSAYD